MIKNKIFRAIPFLTTFFLGVGAGQWVFVVRAPRADAVITRTALLCGEEMKVPQGVILTPAEVYEYGVTDIGIRDMYKVYFRVGSEDVESISGAASRLYMGNSVHYLSRNGKGFDEERYRKK